MKKVFMLLIVLAFSASMLNAEEKAAPEMSLWEKIRARIEKVTPQKKPAVTTAVGGVRGAKSDGGKDLYWKGEEISPSVSEQELDNFKEALTMAEAGDLDQARELFEKLVSQLLFFHSGHVSNNCIFYIPDILPAFRSMMHKCVL